MQYHACDSSAASLGIKIDRYFNSASNLRNERNRFEKRALHRTLPADVGRDSLCGIAPKLPAPKDSDAHIDSPKKQGSNDLVDVLGS